MNVSYDFLSNKSIETNATNWNVSDLQSEDEIELQDDLSPIVAIIFIVVGTIGNCLVCLAILLDRKLQNLPNYFLLSLAVADLLVSLLLMPGRLATAHFKFQPSTFSFCFLFLIGDDFVTTASYIHICFISFERYFAIRSPLTRRTLTKKGVAIKIGLVWVIAFLSIIPFMTFVIIVVVIIAFILTTNILFKLVKKQEENAEMGNSGLVRTVGGKTNDVKSDNKKAFQVLQSEKKALRVVWLVTFAFLICVAPQTCTVVFSLAFPDTTISPIVWDIVVYSTYFDFIFNPIIYTIFNKTFRDDFKNLILCKYKKKK